MLLEVKSQPREPSSQHLGGEPAPKVPALKESLQTCKVKTGDNSVSHLPLICKDDLIIRHLFALMLMKARPPYFTYEAEPSHLIQQHYINELHSSGESLIDFVGQCFWQIFL